MVVYLSGKMTGEPDMGRALFSKVQKKLEAEGITVINPAVLPDGLKPEAYMPICLEMMKWADVVAMLPGWSESKGARLERAFANYLGIKVRYLTKEGRE